MDMDSMGELYGNYLACVAVVCAPQDLDSVQRLVSFSKAPDWAWGERPIKTDPLCPPGQVYFPQSQEALEQLLSGSIDHD